MAELFFGRLDQLAQQQNQEVSFEPRFFCLDREADQKEVTRLVDTGQVRHVHDDLRQQLAGLVDTLYPEKKYTDEQLLEQGQLHLNGIKPEHYGVWVFYPWSGRLVHVLPEDEFRVLRTSRNRNKITHEEQNILRGLRIGVVGLSIGHAAATTLCMEEIGGEFFLADFDELELSNMNRIRAGVQSLGVNKGVIAARDIYEMNPFVQVHLYQDGVTEKNVDDFLAPGGKALDMVYEECDDLFTKVVVRERARDLRIPVLMETSDRGMMDIERFDREPERPIFHGLTGGVKAADLKGQSTFDKVPVILRIINQEGISDRMAASMVDVETTLASWPQLASEVALGAALNTSLARRIALGQFNKSGRFYVDIDEVIADDNVPKIADSQSYDIEIIPESLIYELPPLEPVVDKIKPEHVRNLAEYAGMAFSGGNVQPWNFEYENGNFHCIHDPVRSKSFLDYRNSASQLAFGSLAENIELAGREMGIRTDIRPFPDSSRPDLFCTVGLSLYEGARPEPDALVHQIARRVTNRNLGKRVRLPSFELDMLSKIAEDRGGQLQWLQEPAQLDEIGDLLAEADLLRMTTKTTHQEMMHEIRWTPEEVVTTRDGMDVATLELTPTDLAGLKIIRNWKVMKATAQIGGGLGLKRPMRKMVSAASAVGLLTYPGFEPKSFFEGGRMLQRIWLEITARDIAFQPVTPFTFLSYRLEQGGGEALTPKQIKKLTEIRTAYRRLLDVPEGHCEPMLFRVARAPAPTARSLRRRVDDTLTIR